MNKELIIEQINNGLKNDMTDAESLIKKLNSSQTNTTSFDRFLVNTAIRFVNVYSLWIKSLKENKAEYELDLAVALRNFLLSFETQLSGKYFNFSDDVMKKCSLYLDREKGNVYAITNLADNPFHDQLFKPLIYKEKYKQNHFLITDPYVYKLTGFRSFKSIHQKLAFYGVISAPYGKVMLVDLPTGSGKSLITQFLGAANNHPELTVVVVPTVSLAIDQCRAAREILRISNPEEAIQYYVSGDKNIRADLIEEAINNKKLRLLFISPESLIKNTKFQSSIEKAATERYLANLIIDEAHLVIDWGKNFRPDFMNVSLFERHLKKRNPKLKTVLLSATLDDYTVRDLKKLFCQESSDWIELRFDGLRKEPRYMYFNYSRFNDKVNNLKNLVFTLPHPMIIYTDNPGQAEYYKKMLQQAGLKNIHSFTGDTKSEARRRLIEDWNNNKFSLMIATSAFGVGVDKPDVRTVIHTYIPTNPNAFYQELGRAGRDGLSCLSILNIQLKEDWSSAKGKVNKSVLTSEKMYSRWVKIFNNSAKRKGNFFLIDCSLKPDYGLPEDADSEENILKDFSYSESLSADQHTKWNIYLLFLLYRDGLISIEDIQYELGKYRFLISIQDKRLQVPGEEMQKIFEELREKEFEKNHEGLNLIKDAIDDYKMECWSEMFYETFPLASHYCGGCPEHSEPRESNASKLVMKQIEKPVKENNTEDIFSRFKESLIINDETDQKMMVEKIDNLDPNILIMSDSMVNKFKDAFLIYGKQRSVMLLSFSDYLNLIENGNYYFTSGRTIVLYSEASQEADLEYRRLMSKMGRLLEYRKDHHLIHIAQTDFNITVFNKTISELVNGPRVQLSMLS